MTVSVVLLCGAVMLILLFLAGRRRVRLTELGTMSMGWIAEHQANDTALGSLTRQRTRLKRALPTGYRGGGRRFCATRRN